MDRLMHKRVKAAQRKQRVRSTVVGSAKRPRLSVRFSINHIYAQLIDDAKSVTVVYVSSAGRKLEGSMSLKAAQIGTELAKKAKTAGIKQAVFDRGSKLYHGRIKALADAAREGGLEF